MRSPISDGPTTLEPIHFSRSLLTKLKCANVFAITLNAGISPIRSRWKLPVSSRPPVVLAPGLGTSEALRLREHAHVDELFATEHAVFIGIETFEAFRCFIRIRLVCEELLTSQDGVVVYIFSLE